MTSVRRKDDMNVDLEQLFVLRMPPRAAENLRKDMNDGLTKDKLSLEIHPEKRKGKVVYDGQMYHAKLVDLPCIVESYKTIDKKNFYKTADISQMLICKDEFGMESPEEGEDGVKKKDKEKKCMWDHGLCPPLKNVRKRRFRKTLQKKNPELPDIERELRRLFTMDAQATSFKYEVIYDSDTTTTNAAKTATTTTPNKEKKAASSTAKTTPSSKNAVAVAATAASKAAASKTEKVTKVTRAEDEETMDVDDVAEKNYNPLDIFGPCSSSEGEDERSDSDSRLVDVKKGEESKDVSRGGLDDDDDNSRALDDDVVGGSES